MKLRSILKLALSNLNRTKIRSFLTIFGISIGIGAMVLLISFGEGVRKQAVDSILQIGSLRQIVISKENIFSASGFGEKFKQLTDLDLKKISEIPHVKEIYPQYNLFYPLVTEYKNKSKVIPYQNYLEEEFSSPLALKLEERGFFLKKKK